MTVLKSFDLKGNRKSFAGWISNLSPCDTPFISMIGKEGISQTQYSWQMDALDTPKNSAHEEGSAVVPEKREGTHILHNFTSILRKVVHVSDTVASLDLYGRKKEVEYQMGKSGKELKRDMEFMCLNNAEGFIGNGALASKFSGFTALCAPEGYVDLSTGAVTHQLVNVADMKGPWFKASDIFNLTYNLYLAGSKANKIMFHPQHATTFSDFVGANVESTQTYRMFDGVDNRYNAFISKLRDPLGQKYDLISNRHMPKDKIYIFNEADWTQMILRAPAATKLSKQGSSERFMLETEIGLRHRHINASGVLEMTPSTLVMEWTSKPTPLTWGLGDNPEAEITIKHRDTGLPVADGTVVDWTSSNPAVLALTDSTGHTGIGGKATNVLRPLLPGTSIVTVTTGDGRASYVVTVGNPNIRLRMSNSLAEKDQTVLAVVQVLKADGKPVVNGTSVNFKADPSHLVELQSISADTSGDSGTAQIEVKALKELGVVQLQASVGAVHSNYAKLEIVEKVQELSLQIDQRFIAKGINDSTIAVVSVIDAGGNPIPNQMVSLISTDATVVNSPVSPIDTGATGVALVRLTAAGFGDSVISAQYKEQSIDIVVNVGAPTLIVGGPGSYIVGEEFTIAGTVRRQDNSLVGAGIDVEFESMPPFTSGKLTATTNDKGVALVNYTSMSNSDLEVTASSGNYKSNTITIKGPTLAIGM